MFTELIKSHDRYQIEIKKQYYVDKKKKKSEYIVETYFFIPRSLGISPISYSKEQFYSDIKTYLRLKTPCLELHELIERLEDHLVPAAQKLADTGIKDVKRYKINYSKYKYELRLFCMEMRVALRNESLKAISTDNHQDLKKLVSVYVKTSALLIARIRAIKKILAKRPKALQILMFADEFLSVYIEKFSIKVLMTLRTRGVENQDCLVGLIEGEVEYRQKNKNQVIVKTDDSNEKFLYRRSQLKKYFASVLFFSTKVEQDGFFFEQLLFGLAAGLAMIFATLIAFFSRTRFGDLTPSLFITLVISYMLKDRIKDLFRYYFSSHLGKKIYDHKMTIWDTENNKIGNTRESFQHLKESQVDADILACRSKDMFKDFDSGWEAENVLLYRKKVSVYPRRLIAIEEGIEGLTDILRFNIMELSKKTDNPDQKLFVLEDNSLLEVESERTYHFDLVIKDYSSKGSSYEHWRITFNREGIKEINPVPIS